MISELNSARTIIGRLQIKGAVDDPALAGLRAASLLESADLSVAQVTPSAIVFIRKIRDPKPRTLSLDQSNGQLPAEWNRALADSLRQLASKATRPSLSRVTGNEAAVIFLDLSELLACLATDLCDGVVSARWWWQSLLKHVDAIRALKEMWRQKIEYVPAALEHLARRGALIEVVSRFSDDEARDLVQRLVHAFAVTRITRIKATDWVREARSGKETKVRHQLPMPWRRVVPESDTPRLRPMQQLFVGIALMVHRAPMRIRTVGFAREVERWVERVVEVSDARETVIEVRSEGAAPEGSENLTPLREHQIVAAPVRVATELPQEKSGSFVAEKRDVEQVKIGNAVFTYQEPLVIPDAAIASPSIVREPSPVVRSEPPIETAPPEVFVSPSAALEAVTIETELGGLFYLINLAIFMEIDSEDLSIWDFVMIVGCEINQDRDLDDPIWTGLQDLRDLQDGNLLNPENHENPVNKPAWLADMLPDIHARLNLALGINDADDLAELLLHHHARVIITPTHLDVFFDLAQHPIEIRLSGLDRNPGWVPAAGRFIAFHYD
jgi:hypothetical protein